MDDLSAAIGRIMQNPESMRQLRETAAALGLTGDGQDSARSYPNASHNTYPQSRGINRSGSTHGRRNGYDRQRPEKDNGEADLSQLNALLGQLMQSSNSQPPPAPPPQNGPNIDLSALSGILSGLMGKNEPPPAVSSPPGGADISELQRVLSGLMGETAPTNSSYSSNFGVQHGQEGGGLDLSALSGILGNLGNNLGGGQNGGGAGPSSLSEILGNLTGSNRASDTPSGLSALTAMLGGGNEANAGPMSGMDVGTLLKFQQAISGMNAGAGNVKLMLALKNHLKDEARIAKVDDAIRVMQVVQFLPLLKESGIFGKLEGILDSFNLGGIGNALGGLGGRSGSLGDLLGSLTGGR